MGMWSSHSQAGSRQYGHNRLCCVSHTWPVPDIGHRPQSASVLPHWGRYPHLSHRTPLLLLNIQGHMIIVVFQCFILMFCDVRSYFTVLWVIENIFLVISLVNVTLESGFQCLMLECRLVQPESQAGPGGQVCSVHLGWGDFNTFLMNWSQSQTCFVRLSF